MEQLRARYAQVTDPMQDDTHRLERELKRMAEQDRFDYVIVDSNPDLGYLTTLSLLCWPELKVVIPAFAEESSREAILELYDTIRVLERQDFNRRIEILGFLLTRYENVRIHRHYEKFMQRMAKKMNTRVFSTHIRKCVAVPEAMASKQDICRMPSRRPQRRTTRRGRTRFTAARRLRDGKEKIYVGRAEMDAILDEDIFCTGHRTQRPEDSGHRARQRTGADRGTGLLRDPGRSDRPVFHEGFVRLLALVG